MVAAIGPAVEGDTDARVKLYDNGATSHISPYIRSIEPMPSPCTSASLSIVMCACSRDWPASLLYIPDSGTNTTRRRRSLESAALRQTIGGFLHTAQDRVKVRGHHLRCRARSSQRRRRGPRKGGSDVIVWLRSRTSAVLVGIRSGRGATVVQSLVVGRAVAKPGSKLQTHIVHL